ncbi:hypothetical protein HY380_02080 [Candidatus Saccharibacteria bacterium]|nr:hypothetical protein [Candidatus Saccharibacteria bacterium]
MPPQQTPNDDQLYSPSQTSNFDFIMNAGQKPKSKMPFKLPGGGPLKILMILVVLMVIVLIVVGLFGGGNQVAKVELLDIAARQQEIIRVGDVAQELLQDETSQNLEATTQATLTSQQVELMGYLSGNNIKVGDKDLASRQNGDTDDQLTTARQSNKADSLYQQYLKQQLTDYRGSLRSLYDQADSQLKNILSSAYDSTGVVLEQL